MRVPFPHGLQSTPGGLKPTYLIDYGHDIVNLPSPKTTVIPLLATPTFLRPLQMHLTKSHYRMFVSN
jgi:hypothetical protein